MREEIIISGRHNPLIDPHLQVWGWEIPLYLFVGGVSAGILIFAAIFTIRGKAENYPAVVRYAPLIVPVLLTIGLAALFLDLRHKLYFWRLYTTLKLQSPMSWGAWTLMVVTPLSVLWGAVHLKQAFPKFNWKNKRLKSLLSYLFIEIKESENINWEWRHDVLIKLEKFVRKHIVQTAWIMLVFSILLGVYTGILLSAFNARPLWNTSILGPLFLVSGISAGAAVIMLFSKSEKEKNMFRTLDIITIFTELFLITHMFMGFLASTQAQINAANLFLGGPYTMVFWIFVVFMGLIMPLILEILEIKGRHIPQYIAPLLILTGGIFLRFVIVYAGQASRYLY